jgi:hypothetical protein
MMSDTYFHPRCIETRKIVKFRDIGSVREAAEALIYDWPVLGRGPWFKKAQQVD